MSTAGGRVVPLPTEEFGLHGHLAISHSCVVPSTWGLGALTAAHEEDHEYPEYLTHPHTHTDPEPEEEWSWD